MPMDGANPCKTKPKILFSSQATRARIEVSNKVQKTKYACMVEAHEPTRQRAEPPVRENHEDHIASKGYNSMTHNTLVNKFIPMPQAMKIRDAKAAVDKIWKKLETIPAWQLDKSPEQEGGYSKGTERQKESPLRYIDGHLSSFQIWS